MNKENHQISKETYEQMMGKGKFIRNIAVDTTQPYNLDELAQAELQKYAETKQVSPDTLEYEVVTDQIFYSGLVVNQGHKILQHHGKVTTTVVGSLFIKTK